MPNSDPDQTRSGLTAPLLPNLLHHKLQRTEEQSAPPPYLSIFPNSMYAVVFIATMRLTPHHNTIHP